VKRAKIEEFFQADDYTEVKVSEFVLESGQDTEIKAMMRLALESFESYIKLNKKIPEEVLVCALIPPRSSCFSAVLSDRLAIIISLKRSTSLTSFNIPIICHFEHQPFLFKLPRFYYNILSHHIRLDNTDKAGLTKVRFRNALCKHFIDQRERNKNRNFHLTFINIYL
jgi:hypothetical protein